MKKAEVWKLFERIVQFYPSFTGDDEKAEAWFGLLQDFPLDVSLENLRQHAMTERFPPTVADIRARQGDQLDKQRSKEQTESYFAQVELWQKNAAPPPNGMRERIYAMTRGGSE